MEKSKVCNGCPSMAVEDWPKGVKACRCMDPTLRTVGIRSFGRTVEIFRSGTVGTVLRPAWCEKGETK